MSAAVAGNADRLIPSGPSTSDVTASAYGHPVTSVISCPRTAHPELVGRTTPRGPPQPTTGPMTAATSRTPAPNSPAGLAGKLSIPLLWLSSSRTVMVSSARRTLRSRSLAGRSSATRPAATSRSTAGAVTGVQRLGALQIRPPMTDRPRRAIGIAAGHDQRRRAELGVGVLGDAGHARRHVAQDAGRP